MRRAFLFFFTTCGILLTGCTRVLDRTKGISNICPVHHVAMEVRSRPIIYGLTLGSGPSTEIQAIGMEFQQVQPRLFPFALQDSSAGGCVVKKEKIERFYVCAECVAAESQWLKQKGLTSR